MKEKKLNQRMNNFQNLLGAIFLLTGALGIGFGNSFAQRVSPAKAKAMSGGAIAMGGIGAAALMELIWMGIIRFKDK